MWNGKWIILYILYVSKHFRSRSERGYTFGFIMVKCRAYNSHGAGIFIAASTSTPITTSAILITYSTINVSTVTTKLSCNNYKRTFFFVPCSL